MLHILEQRIQTFRHIYKRLDTYTNVYNRWHILFGIPILVLMDYLALLILL